MYIFCVNVLLGFTHKTIQEKFLINETQFECYLD
jgi:hypothetical protein